MLNDFPVIDGFSYLKRLRCDLRFISLAVDQYDPLRRAGFYRQKQWTFPRNPQSQPVPARNSLEHELRVGIGAVIWGYAVWLPESIEEGSLLSIQVRDACNDNSIFSEYATLPFNACPGNEQNFLSKPYIVGKPGIVTVEIAITSAEDQPAQLILYGGTPVNS